MASKIKISHGFKSIDVRKLTAKDKKYDGNIVTPGEIISTESGYMRGHGTYMGQNEALHASVLGEINMVNKLLCVKHLNSKYHGEIGDLVIGRIIDVGMKRWRVDTNSRLDSYLLLSSVNLPGGELRRRSLEDEIHMRDFLKEGDLISAEVQIVHKEGSLSLQTRNLKYGKLGQGLFVKVDPYLIQSSRNHFLNFPFGVSVILGKNGYLWIYATVDSTDKVDVQSFQDLPDTDHALDLETRKSMARLRNVILAMKRCRTMLDEASILRAYQASLSRQAKDLLEPEIAVAVVSTAETRALLDSRKMEES